MNIKMQIKNFKNLFETKKEKIFFSLIFLLFINLGIFIIFQGIILNDEIILYERRMNGWFNVLINGIKGEFYQGRPLRSMAAFNAAITNITKNIYFNRVIQVIILGVLLYSLYKLIIRIFNKRTAKIWLLISLSCIPLLFEHGIPNAYNGITLIPFLELSLSFHFWLEYLENPKRKWYVCSLIFWIISLCGYEFLVTYTPIYALIYIFKKKKKTALLECVKKNFFHCLVGVIYILLMFGLQKIINVTYDGVTTNLSDFYGIIRTIYVIAISSLPGAYIFNGKYNYLMNMYKNNINNMQLLFLIPIILILIYIIILLFFKSSNNEDILKNNLLHKFLVILCLISYTIIPILPNSLTSMYQEISTFKAFTWYPVSIFTFFTACLLIAYILTIIMQKKYKIGIFLVLLFVYYISIPVQYMNIVIGNKHINNYERIKNVENVLKTQTIGRLNNVELLSENIFETNDLLAIHDSFWNSIANANNLNITIKKYDDYTEVDKNKTTGWISYFDDEYFCVTIENEAAILSKKSLKGVKVLESFKDKYDIVQMGEGIYDNGYYVYRYIIKDDKYIPSNNSLETFKIFSSKVGSDKNSIIPMYGIENDYWMNKQSEFLVKSLQEGIIDIDVYFPDYDKNNDYYLTISVNDTKPKDYLLTSKITNIKLKVLPFEINDIKINSNFLINVSNNDSRELSWFLSNIVGY